MDPKNLPAGPHSVAKALRAALRGNDLLTAQWIEDYRTVDWHRVTAPLRVQSAMPPHRRNELANQKSYSLDIRLHLLPRYPWADTYQRCLVLDAIAARDTLVVKGYFSLPGGRRRWRDDRLGHWLGRVTSGASLRWAVQNGVDPMAALRGAYEHQRMDVMKTLVEHIESKPPSVDELARYCEECPIPAWRDQSHGPEARIRTLLKQQEQQQLSGVRADHHAWEGAP